MLDGIPLASSWPRPDPRLSVGQVADAATVQLLASATTGLCAAIPCSPRLNWSY